MVLLQLGRCISKTDLASCRSNLFQFPGVLWGLLSAHPMANQNAPCSLFTATALWRGQVPGVQGRVAESQGHGWSEVTSLGSTARRHPLVCFLLEEEAELTSVFQAGSQIGIILVFPAENWWVLAKLKFSTWKFLFFMAVAFRIKN